MSVVVVNAGIGNLGAIPNMLKRLGTAARITADADEIATADRIILPGVGAFDAAMQSLADLGLIELLNRKALGERVPILGVCLGMELLGAGMNRPWLKDGVTTETVVRAVSAVPGRGRGGPTCLTPAA